MRRERGGRLLTAVVALALLASACTDSSDQSGPAGPAATRTAKPVKLTFGVYGDPDEVNAFRRVASSYNAVTSESDVKVVPYDDVEQLTAAVESGEVPDVFLVSRSDLSALTDAGLTRPLSSLLDERGVDIGDAYSRDGLEAFSFDRDLQCMPYGISPDVVFYNKRWIDFDRMAERGLPTPSFDPDDPRQAPRWNLDMYAAAAAFGTRPRRDIKGMYVAPTLRGLAPFIYSGGGQLFDDDDAPTSLALADGDSRDALETVLPLLRDASLSLTDEQLAEATPLEWFERGKLAMVVGNHSLVPELRAIVGLDFDVMPMPTVDDDATVGDITGVCLSGTTKKVSEAADFLVHVIAADSVRQVVRAGNLVPANQTVAISDAFLQPTDLPAHSSVFIASLRSMVIPPLLRNRDALADAVNPLVASLLDAPLLDRTGIDAVTEQIDQASLAVLSPDQPVDPATSAGSGEDDTG